MIALTAVSFSIVLGALAVFQTLLIAGLPISRFAWGGQSPVLPPRLRPAAIASIAVYVIFAFTALSRTGVIATVVPAQLLVVSMWVITGYLFFSILPNLASKSLYEKRLMAPVSALLATFALLIALS